jgi:hypothetical protein
MGHDGAVQNDAPCFDQSLGLAARGNAGAGEEFGDPFLFQGCLGYGFLRRK